MKQYSFWNKLGLYINTLRHLKFLQIYNRIVRKYKILKYECPTIVETHNLGIAFPIEEWRKRELLSPSLFKSLNKKIDISSSNIWNDKDVDLLWIYNLHYFNDLSCAESESTLLNCFIQRWIDENPVEKQGIGWDPYTSSLRIVNWIKYFNKFEIDNPIWNKSLLQQVLILEQKIEFHILANHLFANLKALVFAGLYFKGVRSHKILKKACKQLDVQLEEQFLTDGGHYELSPMYHAILMWDLLDLYNFLQSSENSNNSLMLKFRDKIYKGLKWLALLSHPDGHLSFFNDSCLNNSPELDELVTYAKRLGINFNNVLEQKFEVLQVTYLEKSGYVVVTSSNCNALLGLADIGPSYQPGHAHADTLSFELSLFYKRFIVNSGTSEYGTGVERIRQRSTSAHSTVLIDGQSSSEVWDGFRVARRAKVIQRKVICNNDNALISACHEGYKRLSGSPIHCRNWEFYDSCLIICDKINGSGVHRVEVVFHLHPDVVLDKVREDGVVLLVDGNIVEIVCTGNGKLELECSTYHPEFGLSVDSNKLVYRVECDLPTEVMTKITWRENIGLK